jgi:hypothetical protein
VDTSIVRDQVYWYKLGAISNTGEIEWHGPIKTAFCEEKEFYFSLHQNYPNPFIKQTKIVYEVPGKQINQKLGIKSTAVRISIKIYDVTGRLIKTLIDGQKEPGVYTIVWNGEDESGKKVGTGVYFCKFKAGEKQTIRKIIYVK